MPNNLTPKQKAFADSLRDGLSQTAAYRLHYSTDGMLPETINHESSRLAKNPHIAARLAEADAQKLESWAWTIEKALEEIEINIRGARAAKQYGPARASVRDAVELSGLWKEKKSESDVPIIKQTIILQARPGADVVAREMIEESTVVQRVPDVVDAEYQVLDEPSEPDSDSAPA